MSMPAPRKAIYADLFRLPEDVRAEILAGHIVTSPAPLPRHAKAQGAVRRFVGGPFDDDDGHGGPGGWWIFVEVDIQLGLHDVVRPDLAGWRRERLPNPGDQRPIEVVPDWVCEVLSPSTASRDRVTKSKLYAESGVRHYWLVDADARTLEAYGLGVSPGGPSATNRWILMGTYGDDALARVPPFEAIELPVGRLFLPRSSEPGEAAG